jgi:nucleoside-diphosphate-sugar epimerase
VRSSHSPDAITVQQANGQLRRRLATDRARDWLGFQAAVTLEEGITEVVRWYEQTSSRRAPTA